jgi:ABC-type spermidine/putrescine transport system permease subunit II
MDTLVSLRQLGIELPSPTYIFAAIVFGIVGWLAFRAGRRSGRHLTTGLGITLMLFPYFVSGTAWLLAIGGALCAALWWDRA